MARSDEAHGPKQKRVRYPRMLALRDPMKVQRLPSSAALALGKPKAGMATSMVATKEIPGFLVLPRDLGRHRAIIVIHEWWGLNEWVKEQSGKLAADGYVALAVDLYEGKVTTDPSVARK